MIKRLLIGIFFLTVFGGTVSAQDSLLFSTLDERYSEAPNDSVRLYLLLEVLSTTELDDVDTLISLSKQAISMAQKQQDSSALGYANMFMAGFYAIQSKHRQALQIDQKALEIFEGIKLNQMIPRMLNAVGEDYLNLDLFNEAFDYYRQSLNMAEEAGLQLEQAVAKYNMGRVLILMGQVDRAEEYINESMTISQDIGDSVGIAYSKHDLARIEMQRGDYDDALKTLGEAHVLSVKHKEDVLTPQIITTIAQAFEQKGLYREALIHYDEALKMYEDQRNMNGIGATLFGKGSVSQQMGDEVGAKSYFERCEELATDVGDSELLIDCYESLSIFYEDRNELGKALAYYKKFKILEDSIFSETKKEQFAQVQIEYETAKKDIEIQLLNQKEQQQISEIKNQEFIRNILVVILAFTAVLLFSLYKNNEKRRKINEVLVEQQHEIESKSKELSSLLAMKDKFFSIVSHDLRSPINALVGILELLDEGNLTQKELQEVSHSLRLRLDNTRKLLDTLLDWAMIQMNEINIKPQEINLADLVSENFEFFRSMGEKGIKFVSEVDPKAIVMADRNMLDLVIRNLISNSVKFTNENGEVKVHTEAGPKKTLIVMVEDNGVGMTPEQMNKIFDQAELHTTRGTANERGTGLGLKLCKEFVERMGGNIWVESVEGKGSVFKFTVNKA